MIVQTCRIDLKSIESVIESDLTLFAWIIITTWSCRLTVIDLAVDSRHGARCSASRTVQKCIKRSLIALNSRRTFLCLLSCLWAGYPHLIRYHQSPLT